MREWLEAGGIEPVYEGEAKTPDAAIKQLKASGACLACLCGDDAAYAACGEAFAAAIKAAGVKGLSLAGRHKAAEAGLQAAGVDEFIFAGGDAVAALEGLYQRLGPRTGRAS
jgi:methylmalonyl-CoA mutase